jgi:hypothetical protein
MSASRLLARRLEELRERRYRAHGDKPDFSRLADLFLTSNVRARKTAGMCSAAQRGSPPARLPIWCGWPQP